MIYSLNYGDMLKRQAEIQRLGRMPEPQPARIRVAKLAEVGELTQAAKPDWVWWSKSGAAKTVDPTEVLAEAADVMHFTLLETLHCGKPWPESHAHYGQFELENPEVDTPLPELLLALSATDHLVRTGSLLCAIIARYGFTPDDLARAYWEKTEVNLERWREADEA
ncbi:dUTP diphosphatase [Deinococcus wulumuqiensis]|uniref:dUTPase n=1 Tax=Deinococcus wulumuqiensis TaxID=980427 RepID=A0AAV4K8J0_9DEIO|nr:dUTP diphosphatase [Deinococcus wulumuqiensis]QII20020.1 hypothetical protein G6R31_04040 [Deinococcus wulumuqiensis R12]GGI87012.1 hypothetical protein GCM10010914_21820 [Deinococcus wulumuqiensis]GGP29955.1 hypothetical protein GCM10008021_16060 [Deinococcus wulumuqiensis]